MVGPRYLEGVWAMMADDDGGGGGSGVKISDFLMTT